MMRFLPRRPLVLRLIAVLALLAAVLALGAAAGRRAVASRVEDAARARDLTASWRSLAIGLGGRVTLAGLVLETARGDTAFRAETLAVRLDPWSLIALRPRVAGALLSRAVVSAPAAGGADPDTLPPEPAAAGGEAAAERLRTAAGEVARLLLAPARELPRLELRDVALRPAGAGGRFAGASIAWLDLRPTRGGVRLAARGSLLLDGPIPFEIGLDYGHDDRIAGGARFLVPDADRGGPAPLAIAVDGRVAQDRRAGVVRLDEPARITVGTLPLRLSGSIARAGPRLALALAADGIGQGTLVESLPRATLGPLADLSLRGAFDYRLTLDLDLARPDSVAFTADVIPHGLALDPAGTRLRLFGLEEPFTATVHLPRGAWATRELSAANPHFRPLEEIDSVLVHAVVTNEDGGFFRHRGFNLDAVRRAVAENLKAGAYRRGAGTITMQLARNLYLGHERTLSRKAQEVALAWVLEHLTGVSKRRLLEIYLNVIEWGPGVHGADEAARYFFDRDAGRLTVDEALFLTTVVPAPRKWRYRFAPDGALRPFCRAQMHFIGRAMIAKGWLDPARLPAADSLRVELRGAARAALFPADTLGAGTPDAGRALPDGAGPPRLATGPGPAIASPSWSPSAPPPLPPPASR